LSADALQLGRQQTSGCGRFRLQLTAAALLLDSSTTAAAVGAATTTFDFFLFTVTD